MQQVVLEGQNVLLLKLHQVSYKELFGSTTIFVLYK